MKKIEVLCVSMLFVLIGACHHRGNTMITSSDGQTIEVHYAGDIRFTDDETGIAAISPYGFLKYKRNDREFEAQSNAHGAIEYRFYEDGNKVSLDAQDQQRFLAAAIQDLISMGFDARNRFEKIYHQGGSAAVLDGLDRLKGDYIKALYIEYLLKKNHLAQPDLAAIAGKVGTSLGSDFDKGRLLQKFPVITDSAATISFLAAVKSIGSDFERSNALRHLFDQRLSRDQAVQVLIVANTVASDFEKSQLLRQFPGSLLQDSSVSLAYLDAARNIGSDFEKANAIRNLYGQPLRPAQVMQVLLVANTLGSDFEKANILKDLVEKEPLDSAGYRTLISAAGQVGSDFERANILRQIIEKKIYPGESFNSLVTAINQINTDFDRANILKELAHKDIPSDGEWIALLNAAGQLQSSFEKSNVLIEMAARMPKSEAVKAAYIRAAKSIPEDAEFGRVVKAVE